MNNSDVTRTYADHPIRSGLEVDIESDLQRIQKILSGIKGGWQMAVGSALKRSVSSGMTEAKKSIVKDYSITSSEFLKRAKGINHFNRTSDGSWSASFGYRGYVIPLAVFNTKVARDGGIVTSVMRGKSQEKLNHAFFGKMGSHFGVFERVGESRFPVKELFGPAVPQMIYSREDVYDSVEDKMAEVYHQRIEHEVTRMLNGWGR